MEQSSKYYFAYGSNLNTKQLHYHCRRAKLVGVSKLEGYRLSFNGTTENEAFLTIEPSEDSYVPIAIFNIPSYEIPYLDHYECYPDIYDKKELTITLEGTPITGFIYIMHPYIGYNTPSNDYFKICLEGYEDFSFDRALLIDALIRVKDYEQKKLQYPNKKDM